MLDRYFSEHDVEITAGSVSSDSSVPAGVHQAHTAMVIAGMKRHKMNGNHLLSWLRLARLVLKKTHWARRRQPCSTSTNTQMNGVAHEDGE